MICVVAGPVRGQNERIFLIGGNYRLQTTMHTMQPRGGFFGAPAFKDGEDETQFFFDTRLRLFFDIRPNPLVLINYKMEIGDITFGVDAIENFDNFIDIMFLCDCCQLTDHLLDAARDWCVLLFHRLRI